MFDPSPSLDGDRHCPQRRDGMGLCLCERWLTAPAECECEGGRGTDGSAADDTEHTILGVLAAPVPQERWRVWP